LSNLVVGEFHMRKALVLSLALVALGFTSTGAGYTVIDNEEAGGPTFAWDDIASTGTPVTFASVTSGSASVALPFAFTFFGTSFTSVTVTTEGYLQFGTATAVNATNTTIPSATDPDNVIAVFWDNLQVPGGGSVRTQVLGSAPNRRLVVTWDNLTVSAGTSRRMTFQAALYEGSSAVRLQYLHMSNGSGTTIDYSTGSSASIGIEDATGATGLGYLFNGAPAGNATYSGLAIGFLPSGSTAPWPTGPASTLLSQNFDTGATTFALAGTTPPVAWAVDATPATFTTSAGVTASSSFSSPNSLNFNDGVDYDVTGLVPSGTATSPSIALAGTTSPVLRFRCTYNTQGTLTPMTWDQRWVEVSANGFASTVRQAQCATEANVSLTAATNIGICLSQGLWHEHIVPLDPSWGTVQVRFRFDAVDSILNSFAGWFVDDVQVTSATPPPPPPPPPGGGGTPVATGGDDASREHRFCGGSAGAAASLVWLAVLAAMTLAHRRTHMG